MSEPVDPLVNLYRFEPLAAERLPRMVYDYYAGGAGDEILLRTARAAWDAVEIRYRVLRDVSHRSLATQILGRPHAWPVLVAPMAFQQLAHPDGELATARACAATHTAMVLSTMATRSIEEVRAAAPGPRWFQLYVYRDRELTAHLVRRAELAGYDALVVTVDAPMLGRRERDLVNGFHVPADTPVPNLSGEPRDLLATTAPTASALSEFVATHWDPALSWADIAWLRSITSLPILLKGIVRGDDAALALDQGVAGVIVSNHGGRQLDTAVPTARALREVATAMAGRGTLLVDGGIRRGTDILKALALGAQGVLVGRPVLWGLAVDGEAGVIKVLELLRAEFDLALALAGCRSPAEVTPDLVT
jgi:4-hydroxymandelate oxidase